MQPDMRGIAIMTPEPRDLTERRAYEDVQFVARHLSGTVPASAQAQRRAERLLAGLAARGIKRNDTALLERAAEVLERSGRLASDRAAGGRMLTPKEVGKALDEDIRALLTELRARAK